MTEFGSNSPPAGSMWRGVLDRIPTALGKLTYIAGLRDPVSNAYSHPWLCQAFGARQADRTIRQSHYQVFVEWLALGLEDQKSDLSRFLAGSNEPVNALRARSLIPPQAREVERQLYLTDLETLLDLLRFERRAVLPER